MYDPMVAKLIVWDADREAATRRMLRALDEYEIDGLKTLIPFHKALLATEQWANGETCRDLVEDKEWLKQLAFPSRATPGDDDEDAEKVEQDYTVEVSGRRFDVKVIGAPPRRRRRRAAPAGRGAAPRAARARAGGGAAGGDDARSRRSRATCWKVLVEQGARSRRAR